MMRNHRILPVKVLRAVQVLYVQQLILELRVVLPSFKGALHLLDLGIIDHAVSHNEQDI